MNAKQVFYTMFFVLDKLYDCEKDEILADFLGDMNPFLFKNGMSADPAIYADFIQLWDEEKTNDKECLPALDLAKVFLTEYSTVYHYNLERILKHFNESIWLKIAEFVCNRFPTNMH